MRGIKNMANIFAPTPGIWNSTPGLWGASSEETEED